MDTNGQLIAHDELECPAFSDALGEAERKLRPQRADLAQWHPLTAELEALAEENGTND